VSLLKQNKHTAGFEKEVVDYERRSEEKKKRME
jgi:hypothetical protein